MVKLKSIKTGILFFFLVAMNSSAFAKWPISSRPPLKIRFVDASTKAPIPGAIVKISFHKKSLGLLHETGSVFDEAYVITDQKGYAEFKSGLNYHVFSKLSGIYIKVIHPLYESLEVAYWPRQRSGNLLGERVLMRSKYEIVFSGIDLEEKFGNVKCKWVLNSDGQGVQECVPNIDFREAILEGQKYFQLLSSKNLSDKESENIPRRKFCEEKWRRIALDIFSGSKPVPNWIEGIGNE